MTQDLDGTVNRGRNLTVANNKYIGEALAATTSTNGTALMSRLVISTPTSASKAICSARTGTTTDPSSSDFTPFYFSGARIQIFPTDKIKIEPWFMNGYQTYGKWSKNNSVGLSNYWRPHEYLGFVANFYYGTDTKDDPHRKRFHHDDSILVRYFNRPAVGGDFEDGRQSQQPLRDSVGRHQPVPGPQRATCLGPSLANRIWF